MTNSPPANQDSSTPPDCPGLDACQPAAIVREHLDQLTVTQQRLEAQVRIVAAGHSQLVDQLANVTVTLREQDRRIEENVTRMQSLDVHLRENTELTKDIRDALVAGRVVKRLAIWGGGAALVVAQWWDQIKAALHR